MSSSLSRRVHVLSHPRHDKSGDSIIVEIRRIVRKGKGNKTFVLGWRERSPFSLDEGWGFCTVSRIDSRPVFERRETDDTNQSPNSTLDPDGLVLGGPWNRSRSLSSGELKIIPVIELLVTSCWTDTVLLDGLFLQLVFFCFNSLPFFFFSFSTEYRSWVGNLGWYGPWS